MIFVGSNAGPELRHSWPTLFSHPRTTSGILGTGYRLSSGGDGVAEHVISIDGENTEAEKPQAVIA